MDQEAIRRIERDRSDINRIYWEKIRKNLDVSFSVPVWTADIDGFGPHAGNMTIEDDGADYFVGDWRPA